MRPLGSLLICAACAAQQFQPVAPAPTDALRFGRPVAEFRTTDLVEHAWRSSDLQGKVTLVDIWSSTCGPCRQQHPALQAFHEQAARMNGVQVLTFALDNDPARVRAYMQEHGYTFPVIARSSLASNLFPTEGGIPKTFVIDREGRLSAPFREWSFGRVLLEVERFAKRDQAAGLR
jgi:thiol-disulfide isomerase/thioredoxin